MRVAAVDCALETNKKLCRFHKIEFFPTFYMFEAHVQKRRGEEASYTHTGELFSHDMVKFIETHSNRPAFWPSLTVYE